MNKNIRLLALALIPLTLGACDMYKSTSSVSSDVSSVSEITSSTTTSSETSVSSTSEYVTSSTTSEITSSSSSSSSTSEPQPIEVKVGSFHEATYWDETIKEMIKFALGDSSDKFPEFIAPSYDASLREEAVSQTESVVVVDVACYGVNPNSCVRLFKEKMKAYGYTLSSLGNYGYQMIDYTSDLFMMFEINEESSDPYFLISAYKQQTRDNEWATSFVNLYADMNVPVCTAPAYNTSYDSSKDTLTVYAMFIDKSTALSTYRNALVRAGFTVTGTDSYGVTTLIDSTGYLTVQLYLTYGDYECDALYINFTNLWPTVPIASFIGAQGFPKLNSVTASYDGYTYVDTKGNNNDADYALCLYYKNASSTDYGTYINQLVNVGMQKGENTVYEDNDTFANDLTLLTSEGLSIHVKVLYRASINMLCIAIYQATTVNNQETKSYMKKQLFLAAAILAGLVISGCDNSSSKSESSSASSDSTELTSVTSSTTNGVSVPTTSLPTSNPISITSIPDSSSSSSSSNTTPPPIILGGQLEEALKKDYKNMLVEFALNSTFAGEEWGWEYYLGGSDFVAVLNGNVAETYGLDSAWDFYSYYNGNSYSYWDTSMHYQTEGWIAFGSKQTPVGIDNAYFFMPYFLSTITEDDVTNVLGTYVVKETSIDKVLGGLKFSWTNDISYIDFAINEEGYIYRIRGFDDPNDDEYGFDIKLSQFGTTTAPESVILPPAISASNIKTYADMLGHEEEPDIYLENITININDTVTSDATHQIVMYPDDVVDLSFSYLPTNANKKEVHWHSSNENVAELLYSQESGHHYLRAVSEGETEITVTHVNGNKQTITSNTIKVKVNAPKQVEASAEDVYRFSFIDSTSVNNDGHYNIYASNDIAGSEAPFFISSWRINVRDGRYSDNFAEDDIVLYSAPNNQTCYTERFEDEVLFDFANQQVNKISFSYALFRCNSKNSLSLLESVKIYTSNDGDNWTAIDVTEEMRTEFNKASLSTGMSPKVMSKEFLPASMVKVVLKANQIGGNDLSIGMKDFTFSADENCRNYDDVDAVPVESISISAPRDRIKLGTSMKFTATINPSNASNKNVRWISSNPEVISIDPRTGFATALVADSSATITAVSTSDSSIVSNALVISTYEQETIGDFDNIFIGHTFCAKDVMSGNNKYDVTFTVNSEVAATLLLELDLGLGQPIEIRTALTYDHYDTVSKIYEFVGANGELVNVKLAEDGSHVELTYRANADANYTFGDETGGIILTKVK